MKASGYDVLGFQQITSTGTADIHSLTVPQYCSAILVSVETTSVRMTFDGSAPSGTAGHVIPAAQAPVLLLVGGNSNNPPKIQFASTALANGIVDVTYLS